MKNPHFVRIQKILGPLVRFLFPISLEGTENLPEDRPVMLCANHSSAWDPVLFVAAIRTGYPLRIMAKKQLLSIPILGRILQNVGAFAVDRGNSDIQAVKTAIQSLKQGWNLLIPQVEEKLGRKLKTADLQVLAGLYDDLGMPADVIYLLVNHCITRSEERYGPGRRPTLRQIEKEGYYWARQGLFDQDSAARYLKTWRDKQQGQSAYMQVLGLGQRRPVASEEKYISDWMDKGFPPETVALAYDKTIFYKKQLEWRYLNGILRRWHENGWHTPEEVQQGDAGKPAQPSPKPDKPDQDNSRMEKYMKW